MIADYRVPAELSSIDTTADGKSVLLGTLDGCLTMLTIADPKNPKTVDYLLTLPSRNEEVAITIYPYTFIQALLTVWLNVRLQLFTARSSRHQDIQPFLLQVRCKTGRSCSSCTGKNRNTQKEPFGSIQKKPRSQYG